MATDYGFDTACVSDVGLVDVVITSPQRVIGERIARILQTRRGGLSSVDPTPEAANLGLDVRQFLLSRMSPSAIAQAAGQISAECTKDEEVSAADVTLVFSQSTGAMTITIQLTSAAGPFKLTMNVQQVGAAAMIEVIFG